MKGGTDGDNQDAMWNFHVWCINRNIFIEYLRILLIRMI